METMNSDIKNVDGNDKERKLWFKRKPYGWGWVPSSWEGWVVLGVFVALAILLSLHVDEDSKLNEIFFTFISPLALLTFILIYICYKKGEKPRWQWGAPKEDVDDVLLK